MSFKTYFPDNDKTADINLNILNPNLRRCILIKKISITILVAFAFLCITAQNFIAQGNEKNSIENELPIEYEPNPSHPYGKINPDAPPETNQFDFMIGEFDCTDKIQNQKGEWSETKVVWNSTYFLNGYGVQDKFWSKSIVASGTRIFDKKKGKWIVNYFQTFPTYFAGVWEGKKEGDKMIMRAARGENESRLTFHNIKENGFDWIGETVTKEGKATPFWIISCKRRS